MTGCQGPVHAAFPWPHVCHPTMTKLSWPHDYLGLLPPTPPSPHFGADTIVVYDRATTNHTGKFKRCVRCVVVVQMCTVCGVWYQYEYMLYKK